MLFCLHFSDKDFERYNSFKKFDGRERTLFKCVRLHFDAVVYEVDA